MQPPIPYNYVNLVGDGIMRGVTVVRPTDEVRNLLPCGLELGKQALTPKGTHPLILYFWDMVGAHMTIPTLLPMLAYHEQIVGIPYTYVSAGYQGTARCGPFFYTPRLNLDDYLATIGGVLYWGYPKRVMDIAVTEDHYAVSGPGGDPMISLDFEPVGDYRPMNQYPDFRPICEMMCQPHVTQMPLAVGPWFVCSKLSKKWSIAQVQPLSTVVRIEQAFVPGLPCGRFPAEGRSIGIDRSPLGSYVLKTRWRLSLIYPPSLHAQPFSP